MHKNKIKIKTRERKSNEMHHHKQNPINLNLTGSREPLSINLFKLFSNITYSTTQNLARKTDLLKYQIELCIQLENFHRLFALF